ncbi:MAG TPA: vanadium-dependent haloperoxidase [Steroidobacteraceae bacterium]|nr:vanadium-dependent haloperoxidase [Steroidobacteraceae bacterium]
MFFADSIDLAGARTLVPRLSRIGVLTAALALAVPGLAQDVDVAHAAGKPRGNAVTHWNTVATDALTPAQGTNPMAHSRILSVLSAAVHDAVNAIDRRFEAYTPGLADAPGASVDAAVAAAAHDVLAAYVPEQAVLVEAAYARALADIPDIAAKANGIAVGQASAAANMLRRRGDGSEEATQPVYVPRSGAGEYQFTPPFDFAAQPGWGRVKPFVIDLREHALEGPDSLTSVQYARDLAYVKAIGGIDSRIRTGEQSEIAQFWYEDSTLGWNRIANTAVKQQRLDNWSAARAFALVNFAMADGFIVGFEAKYHFRFWRPETAIRYGANGGKRPKPDADWKPFQITPPVPDYPSTHTVLGWAAAEVLIDILGDRVRYSADSLTLPGVTRRYKGFSAPAEENGLSRVYAGIHFVQAVKDGRRQGRSVGRAVAEALPRVR